MTFSKGIFVTGRADPSRVVPGVTFRRQAPINMANWLSYIARQAIKHYKENSK
jgi:hypothetical protein